MRLVIIRPDGAAPPAALLAAGSPVAVVPQTPLAEGDSPFARRLRLEEMDECETKQKQSESDSTHLERLSSVAEEASASVFLSQSFREASSFLPDQRRRAQVLNVVSTRPHRSVLGAPDQAAPMPLNGRPSHRRSRSNSFPPGGAAGAKKRTPQPPPSSAALPALHSHASSPTSRRTAHVSVRHIGYRQTALSESSERDKTPAADCSQRSVAVAVDSASFAIDFEFTGLTVTANGEALSRGDLDSDPIVWRLRLLESVTLDCRARVARCRFMSGKQRSLGMSKPMWNSACALAGHSTAPDLAQARRSLRLLRSRVLPFTAPAYEDMVYLERVVADISRELASVDEELNVQSQETHERHLRARQLCRGLIAHVMQRPERYSRAVLSAVLATARNDMKEREPLRQHDQQQRQQLQQEQQQQQQQRQGEESEGTGGSSESSAKWVQMREQRPSSMFSPALLMHAVNCVGATLSRRGTDVSDTAEMREHDAQLPKYAEFCESEAQLATSRELRNRLFSAKIFAMNVREVARGTVRSLIREHDSRDPEADLHAFLRRVQDESGNIGAGDLFYAGDGAALVDPRESPVSATSSRSNSAQGGSVGGSVGGGDNWETASVTSEAADLAARESVTEEVLRELTNETTQASTSLVEVQRYVNAQYSSEARAIAVRQQRVEALRRDAVKDMDLFLEALKRRVIASHPSLGDAVRRAYVRPAIERVLFPMVFFSLMPLYERENHARDAQLSAQIRRFHFLLPSQLNVRRECCVAHGGCSSNSSISGSGESASQSARRSALSPYATAVDAFAHFVGLVTPAEKIGCILATLREINRCAMAIQRTYTGNGDADSLGCEELLVLFSCVIVHSGSRKLFSQAEYVSDFVDKQQLLGEYGYGLVTLQMALEFLLSLQPSDLVH